MEAAVNFMPRLLYSQGNNLHYPLNRGLRESLSQSMLCRHEESPTLGQNQTLIPQATTPYPRHHVNKAIPATKGIISPNCNTTRCQSEVHYINSRCYCSHWGCVRRISGHHIYSEQTGGVHFGESVSMRQQSRPQTDLNVSIGTINSAVQRFPDWIFYHFPTIAIFWAVNELRNWNRFSEECKLVLV